MKVAQGTITTMYKLKLRLKFFKAIAATIIPLLWSGVQARNGWIHSNVCWGKAMRGGASDSFENSLPVEQLELNRQAHEAEIEENTRSSTYHRGQCGVLPEGLLQTKGYSIGKATLPDFDNEFRRSRGDELIQITTKPFLSEEECDQIVSAAETFFEEKGSWGTLPSGRFQIAGSWIKDVEPVRMLFNELLKEKLFPALAEIFPDVVTDPSLLCVQSAYLFKYTPASGEKTDMHMDSSLMSFTILINDEDQFEGGGTFFENLGEDAGEVVSMKKGYVTFRPGGVRHRGQPITKGERYVIGGFVTIRGREGCEHTRQLLTRGTRALADGDTAVAKELFELARDFNPEYAETYMSVAHCLRKFGDSSGALRTYEAAFDTNPRNADSAFMVGVMHAELGDDGTAMKWYQTAAALNEYDGDAWYRQGLLLGRRGDPSAERSMYEKAIAVQPNHADAYCNLGVSYGEAGNSEKEIDCYDRALEIEPENEDALNNAKAAYYYRGVTAYQQGDLETSLSSFRRILDHIEPGEPSVMQAYKAVFEKKLAMEAATCSQ